MNTKYFRIFAVVYILMCAALLGLQMIIKQNIWAIGIYIVVAMGALGYLILAKVIAINGRFSEL